MELADRDVVDILFWAINKTHDYINLGNKIKAKVYYDKARKIHFNYYKLNRDTPFMEKELRDVGTRYNAKFRISEKI
ncbi:MAG: hypothetical protein AABX19_00920 [Nanoarchaeota archaeon]